MALASSPDYPQPLRVIAHSVKGWVERLGAVWVIGQVIALKRQAGSTHFLTLRDRQAEISCSVTCGTAVLDAAGPLHEGMEVVAWLKPTVWLPNGRLNYDCHDLRPVGPGRLLAEIEQRKRRLQAEGLFAPERKRPLPVLPRLIGLITGRQSAAERDVLVTVQRRWPAAQFEIRHCLMQGPKSVDQISQAVYELDALPQVDVIVIARGGGSVEDLLPFSDETLVRVVAAAGTPIVSAVGHETDTPILDLVADARASTPTDAAKRIVPDAANELSHVVAARQQLRRAIADGLDRRRRELDGLQSRPVLRDPLGGYAVLDLQLTQLTRQLTSHLVHQLDRSELETQHLIARIRALSPEATLDRGYAILISPAGDTITEPDQVSPGDAISARLATGSLSLNVTATDTAPPPDQDDQPDRQGAT
ncbi:MAG: exodeoxyribonuclease VII large subunit [Propionibacteriaceae bacterium]|jgi:exodeoxyribonuclease VII large subunit|nr:exodeoxyribonuclease VII large subunit [Propionibacteriaceae bacterium]